MTLCITLITLTYLIACFMKAKSKQEPVSYHELVLLRIKNSNQKAIQYFRNQRPCTMTLKESKSEVAQSCPTLRSRGLQSARLLCPWDFPDKYTRVGYHLLLQGIFPTHGLNPGLLHCRQILYHLSHQGSPMTLKVLFKQGDMNQNCIIGHTHCEYQDGTSSYTLILREVWTPEMLPSGSVTFQLSKL